MTNNELQQWEEWDQMYDVMFRYNVSSKWKHGKIGGIVSTKRGLRYKVYRFVENAKLLDWENRTNGLPNYKIVQAWVFFCWLPGKNINLNYKTQPQ